MAGNRRKRAEKKKPSKRLNVMLRDESIQRLMLHVVMLRQNPGDILSDLIDAHLRQYKVQANSPARAMSEVSVESADHGTESAPIAA
jgi:broad-specificity NMP kinase